MANKEDYLDALTAYSKSPSKEIPAILEQYLNSVAKNGETLFHWQLLKPLIVGKMDQVVEELRQRLSSEHIPDRPNVENVRFDVMRDRIMDALNKFNGAPFTIQRLCELLIDPKRHYRRSDKFLRGLEKNVLVVSTVDPFGRKVVSESSIKHLVNGIDSNGSPFFPRDSSITSNLPPVPGWVTTSSPRPQNTPATEASDQKPLEQKSHTSSVPTGERDSGDGISLDVDQKEAVVHSEVVVEETVVTMDTSETGTVATDGGEAMAEVDDNEEEMQDDTSASSSSSSPEESDTGDSSAAQTETSSAVTSSTQASTWTSDSSETDNSMDTSSSDCHRYSSDSPVPSHDLQSSDEQVELTSSSEASSLQKECSEKVDSVATSVDPSSDPASEQESSASSFDASAARENVASSTDPNCHGLDNSDSCSMTASEVESYSSHRDIGDIPSSTDSSFLKADVKIHEPLSSETGSLTEVIATSTTDFLPSITSVVCAETQDSVAGLERLVDSVDTSILQAPISSVSTLPPLTSTPEENSESSALSSIGSSLDCEKSETKHHQILSDEEGPSSPSTYSSTQVSASSEAEASSSNSTSVKSETVAEAVPVTTEDHKSELAASPATVSCSEDAVSSSPNVSSDGGSSLPPQLSSPSDSHGFDVIENTSNTSADDK